MTKQVNKKIYKGGNSESNKSNLTNADIARNNQINVSSMFNIQSVPSSTALRSNGLQQQRRDAQQSVDATNLTMKGGRSPNTTNGNMEFDISDFSSSNNKEEALAAVQNMSAAIDAKAYALQGDEIFTRCNEQGNCTKAGGGRRRRRSKRRKRNKLSRRSKRRKRNKLSRRRKKSRKR